MINTIIDRQGGNQAIPAWMELVPEAARGHLGNKRKIRSLMEELAPIMIGLNDHQRRKIVNYVESQNDIEGLLSGEGDCMILDETYEDVLEKIKSIFEESFELLRKTRIRNKHYKKIYDSLKSKTCPFCGYMPLDGSGLKSEDLDHYLDRQRYPSAAANFKNLVPTCGKCNSRYKGTANLIFKDDIRRRAINPYGTALADVCLRETDLFGMQDSNPEWEVKLLPEIEEVETWNDVYNVRNRLLESVLSPNYESTLDEMIDFFMNIELDTNCSNHQLLEAVNRFYQYKYDNPEQGLGFLKHKIVDIFRYQLELENQTVIAMIRAGLKEPDGVVA
jgi:5-methylcytosine-specific restriction endonuclease McrA